MNETQLANLALGHLGEAKIMDLQEDTPAARRVSTSFGLVRDSLLRSHHWNFAIKRASLSRLAADPLSGFAYQYQLPTDCLRVLEVNGRTGGNDAAAYSLEARAVLTDDETVIIRYVARITDTEQWDSQFCDAFGYRLASHLAPAITGSESQRDALFRVAEGIAMGAAKGSDSRESRPEVVPSGFQSAFDTLRQRSNSGSVPGRAGTDGTDGQGFTWRGVWALSTAYAAYDVAKNDGDIYLCTAAHTSAASTEPGTGASWASYWALWIEAPSGAGSGDMTGPASSTDGNLPSFSGTGGKTLQDSTISAASVAAAISKLAGIEVGATADQSAAEILAALLTVDGSGTGLDADLLDGNQATAFATAAQGTKADGALRYDAAQSLDDGEKKQAQENIGFDDTGTVGFVFRSDTSGVLSQIKSNLTATSDPGINNGVLQNYLPGSLWLNTTTPALFQCVDNTAGAAVWHQVSPQTAAQILALLLTADGAGTGLDADLLDGQHAAAFAAAFTGTTGNLVAFNGSSLPADSGIAAGLIGYLVDRLYWTFSTTTTDSDPGAGIFRANNATPASITFLYVDDAPAGASLNPASDAGSAIANLGENDHIYIEEGGHGTGNLFRVTGAPTDGSGYWKIPVAHVSGDTLFIDGYPCSFRFIPGKRALANASEAKAATSTKPATPDNFADYVAPQTLTDAATVAFDVSLGVNGHVTLGGNRTLGAPTNGQAGQSGIIRITQDGTGSRTLSYNAVWKFPGGTAPTLSTAAGSVDLLAWYSPDGTNFEANLIADLQ